MLVKQLFSLLSVILGVHILNASADNELDDAKESKKYKIEGKVSVSFTQDTDWIASTRVLVDGGDYLGFLKSDGSFSVSNLPSGSYVVEVTNPVYVFEPSRIDINSKGKIRARRLNYIQPSQVSTMPYPLKVKAKGKANYFQQREQWRITDFLFSPMVLMMVLPFVLMVILPKLVNTQDPETQKEMQQSMNLLNPKQNMPDMSEMLTSFFGGGAAQPKKKQKPAKKRQ